MKDSEGTDKNGFSVLTPGLSSCDGGVEKVGVIVA